MYGWKAQEKHKFIIEFEDIITSLDKQNVYMKIKTKVGSISGICKVKYLNTLKWQNTEVLGLVARSDANNNCSNNLQDTFLELTITRALTNNVHNKWGTKKMKRNPNLNFTLTEIMFHMQTIDIKLDLLMLYTFVPIFTIFSQNTVAKPLHNQTEKSAVLSVSDLPLIYFQSKGIRVFIPMLNNNDVCNVLIFKVN